MFAGHEQALCRIQNHTLLFAYDLHEVKWLAEGIVDASDTRGD